MLHVNSQILSDVDSDCRILPMNSTMMIVASKQGWIIRYKIV